MGQFFYTYEQMQQEIKALERNYPEIFQKEILGHSSDSRQIVEVLLGKKAAAYHVLIHAAIHGREYMNTALVMRQIRESLSESYQDICFHVVPMVNPDGVTICQEGIKGIRDLLLRERLLQCWRREGQPSHVCQKDYFRIWKANARGVDLNRNFDAGWQEYHGAGFPSSQGYKGRYPAQEPEVLALLSIQRRYPLDACIAYHSSGNLIYWNYGSEGKILTKDYRLAEAIAGATGYELHSTVLDKTDAAGCSDYFVRKCGIPSVTIETGSGKCPLAEEEFPEIYRHNRDVWRAAAAFVRREPRHE